MNGKTSRGWSKAVRGICKCPERYTGIRSVVHDCFDRPCAYVVRLGCPSVAYELCSGVAVLGACWYDVSAYNVSFFSALSLCSCVTRQRVQVCGGW